MILATSAASLVVRSPAATADTTAATAATVSRALSTGGSSKATGSFLRIDARRSMHTRIAAMSPSFAISIALRAGFLAYVPKFVLGGLLLYSGLYLLYRWLLDSWRYIARWYRIDNPRVGLHRRCIDRGSGRPCDVCFERKPSARNQVQLRWF